MLVSVGLLLLPWWNSPLPLSRNRVTNITLFFYVCTCTYFLFSTSTNQDEKYTPVNTKMDCLNKYFDIIIDKYWKKSISRGWGNTEFYTVVGKKLRNLSNLREVPEAHHDQIHTWNSFQYWNCHSSKAVLKYGTIVWSAANGRTQVQNEVIFFRNYLCFYNHLVCVPKQ